MKLGYSTQNDVNNGGINTVTWEDISEAIENDEKLTIIRNALKTAIETP